MVGQLNWPEIEHNRDTTHSKHATSAHVCCNGVFVRAPLSLCVPCPCVRVVFELNVPAFLTNKTFFYRKKGGRATWDNPGPNFTAKFLLFCSYCRKVETAHMQIQTLKNTRTTYVCVVYVRRTVYKPVFDSPRVRLMHGGHGLYHGYVQF